jgi:hypothetical protein
VALEVAVDHPAAVEEDEERVGGGRSHQGARDVEAGVEGAAGAAHGPVLDLADRLVAADDLRVPPHRDPALRDREVLDRPLQRELLHPQHQLGLRGERQAVDPSRPAREPAHGLGAQGHGLGEDPGLGAKACLSDHAGQATERAGPPCVVPPAPVAAAHPAVTMTP